MQRRSASKSIRRGTRKRAAEAPSRARQEMEQPPPKPVAEATGSSAMREFVGEAIGVDFSLLRTIKDLTRTPSTVVESFLRHERTYVSPFKALFTIAAIWVLVMNFLFDWHAIGREYATQLFEALESLGMKSDDRAANRADQAETIGMLFHAIFARYFIVFVLAIVPAQAAICMRLTGELGVPLRAHLAVLAYQTTLKIIVGFALAVGLGVNVLLTFVVLTILAILAGFGWRPAVFITETVPTERFFSHHGREISAAYHKASIIVLAASMGIGIAVGLIAALLGP